MSLSNIYIIMEKRDEIELPEPLFCVTEDEFRKLKFKIQYLYNDKKS
ncbi:hypothetical protein KN1_18020 [Stygiolobus caldivivus]|uniref:Uncharacterized protein n=1 Tax=Stygiolobus caldivivus TaxID=2824673 RepID=A0A8D5U7J0_9CREN|nr:hypothetical protein KN1_18020 [Stygiolobus caldivivus]